MRISLQLIPEENSKTMPVNYQHPLSVAIHKIMSSADGEFTELMHRHGFEGDNSLKNLQLFTFSSLTTPFEIQDDRLLMKGPEALMTVCFHLPDAASDFVCNLFQRQQIEVSDAKSNVMFRVRQAKSQPLWRESVRPDAVREIILQPASPIVSGVMGRNGRYDYLYPDDERFVSALLYHWKEKYSELYGGECAESDFENVNAVMQNVQSAKGRLITIEAGTPQERKIRGFTHFRILVKAKVSALELAMNSGIGLYNRYGFGCVVRV